MISISILTGNKNKFRELQEILGGDVHQVDIELHEIQEIDPHKIIEHKLEEAIKHGQGPYIVDDSSLFLDCLGGKLPGPLIKWFEQAIGLEGIVNLAQKMGDTHAVWRNMLGYANSLDEMKFFEGEVTGTLVFPRGTKIFGWDAIFIPDGFTQTFAEMTPEQKHTISARGIAGRKLKEYLRGQT